QDDVDPSIHQRHRKLGQKGDISVAPLRDQHEIASLHPTSTFKSAQECPEVALGRWCSPQEADPSHPLPLLRDRRERPHRRRAADERDELAPPHGLSLNPRTTPYHILKKSRVVHHSKIGRQCPSWVIRYTFELPKLFAFVRSSA